MYSVDVYVHQNSAKIRPLSVKRDWMHNTTYSCFPLALANTFGYGVYYENDISFIWDGSNEPAQGVLGKNHIWVGRGQGTVSFATGLTFKSNENVSLLTMPVPNTFMEEAVTLSSILSTSFFTGELSIVWKINPNFANKEIFIPAGKEVAAILPLSTAEFKECNINVIKKPYPFSRVHDRTDYVDTLHKALRETGKTAKLYRQGIDEHGNVLGNHEVSKFNMKITELEN
jgi:hypothetical protein